MLQLPADRYSEEPQYTTGKLNWCATLSMTMDLLSNVQEFLITCNINTGFFDKDQQYRLLKGATIYKLAIILQ